MPNVIILKGEPAVRDEFIAVGAITPGDLVDPQAGVVHAAAGESAEKTFADFNPWVEPAAGVLNIDQDYPIGDTVLFFSATRGMWVYATLTTSQTVAAGDKLESAGNGHLQLVATDVATDDLERDSTVAYAVEAVTTTGTPLRIRVRVA